jgi:N-acetylglucosamine kinase-like BadF-type ATPase
LKQLPHSLTFTLSYPFSSKFPIFVEHFTKIHQLKYVLGIDSGATSSEVLLIKQPFTGTDRKAAVRKYPSINLNILGFDESARRLVNIITDTQKRAGKGNIITITAGISGARLEKDRRKLERAAKKATGVNNIIILPDTETAFAAAFEPGMKNCGIMIAGTGSILYYRDAKGVLYRVGGWGRHLGDEGSGYWIAREALNRITKYYDGREKPTRLVKILKEEFCIDSTNIIKEVYHNNFEVSKFTRHVFRAAERGDIISGEIIRSAAENLLSHLIPLKNRSCRIALMGSLFTEEKLLGERLMKLAKKRFNRIEFFVPRHKPVWGAVKIAMISARS